MRVEATEGRALKFAERAGAVPFLEKGRSWDGWDCWGLVYTAFRDYLDIEIPSYDGEYGSTRRRRELAALISLRKSDSVWKRVDGPVRAWDGVLANMFGIRCHMGLMLNDRLVIHTEERISTVVEDTTRPPWSGPDYTRIEGVYRHVDLL